MAIRRRQIIDALKDLIEDEEGMRFQGLAVIIGKMRWPQLIAHQRKRDLGLDAYAPASESPRRIGKGLAASITPMLRKISTDVKKAKTYFPELKQLLFVTAGKVGNANRISWAKRIQDESAVEIFIVEREEIITLLMMPENAELCARFLHLEIDSPPTIADLIEKTRRAAAAVTQDWVRKIKGRPLIDLTAIQLDPYCPDGPGILPLNCLDTLLSQRNRILLEGPAGCGKTTTLIQLAQRQRFAGTPILIHLPAWVSSHRGILEFIAAMPTFLAEGVSATDLAQARQTESYCFLLDGWNEIAHSDSERSHVALRELEREFPSAGIIVATRAHHLKPPLPDALRLRLRRLEPRTRTAYIEDRLGGKGTELRRRIEADSSLDELTRNPFVLSEVVALFEARARIFPTKFGILAQVVRLQERRMEHLNALAGAPIFGQQTDYLKALAAEMTHRSAVELSEAQARAIVAEVGQALANGGQIQPAAPATVLATLTGHHVLERVDYPATAIRFDHQQLQEYFAALDLQPRLLDLRDDDSAATGRFTANYVNDPTWAEPLRMIAATFDETSNDAITADGIARAGARLVEMALAVDLVFAGELVRICGMGVWEEVRPVVGDRFRAVYATGDSHFRHYAVAAMLATGMDAFSDVIVPLLSGKGEQTRLRTFDLWPDVRVTSLGRNWRDEMRSWSEEAQAGLVSELLHQRIDRDVVAFAIDDGTVEVKRAAVLGLMWHRSDDVLTRVLTTLDAQTFEDVSRKHADLMPRTLRSRTIAALRKFLETSTDQPARLRTALSLAELGETDLDGVVKEAMATLPDIDMYTWHWGYIQPALKHLCNTDPAWASEWVANQIADGVLYSHEHWMPFATIIPDHVVDKYLRLLETTTLDCRRLEGVITVIATSADVELARRVVAKSRQMWRTVDAEPDQPHEVEQQVIRQLRDLFRQLPDNVAAASIISSVTDGDVIDVKVATRLLSRVGIADKKRLHIADSDIKARLRAYLKNSIDLVLRQNDFTGENKANLASSIAQVGEPEDIGHLLTLIHADIERLRSALAARATGNHGPLANAACWSYANWNVEAVVRLDPVGADQVLIDLLREPEYRNAIAVVMARPFRTRPERSPQTPFRYDLMWAAREGSPLLPDDDQRRTRFATALRSEITRLREHREDPQSARHLQELGRALAAIDGRRSAALVLDVIAMSSKWDEHTRLEAAERLLMAGVALPAATAFALVDSLLKRTGRWMQDSDRYLLRCILALCPLVDDPEAGIAKVRDVLRKRPLRGYALREVVAALGESRSDAATGLLRKLASNEYSSQQLGVDLVNAIATLDTHGSRELLLGFVDPDLPGVSLTRHSRCEDLLVARLTALAQRSRRVNVRLQRLCNLDLPERNRHLLSRIMASLGTSQALAANLNLIDDSNSSPVPRGVRDQLESAFVQQRPAGDHPNSFTLHARASNAVRAQLFWMALHDLKRRKSAFMLLGMIEGWRLEHGRPTGEPRHPSLASGQSWPPAAP